MVNGILLLYSLRFCLFLTNLNTVFVPPTDSEEQVLSYSKNSTVKSLAQSFGQKTRTLKRFFGVFFSVA